MNFKPLSKREESIAEKIVDAAYTIHKTLGPGLLEKVYEVCFCHELSKRKLKHQRQVDIPIVYDGTIFDEGLRLDVLVEDLIICASHTGFISSTAFSSQIIRSSTRTSN
ncbi:MAG: GxxExxY protein, partial [Proteobacteria bacterium]|nr:GxxExxY protein [Pseudomonadota bacterium]